MKILFCLLFLLSIVASSQEEELSFAYLLCSDYYCEHPATSNIETENSHLRNSGSESREIKRNELLRNSYLPRQVSERFRTQNESLNILQQMTQDRIRYTEESTAFIQKLNSIPSSGKHMISSSVYYVLTDDNIQNLQTNYTASLDAKNYYTAVDIANKIFHSNSSIDSLPGFNKDGIFIPEQINTEIPKSPGASIKLESSKSTTHGRNIRRILNDYQIYWAMNSSYFTQESLTYYNTGLAYIKISDQYSNTDPDKSRGYAYLSLEIIDFLNGIQNGIQNQIEVYKDLIPLIFKEATEFIFNAKYYPDKAADSLVRLVQKTPEIAQSFYKGLVESYDTISKGTSSERGELVGGILTDTAFGVLTGGSVISSLPSKSVAQNLSKNLGQKIITELSDDVIRLSKILEKTPKPMSNKVVDGFIALKNSGSSILQTQTEDILNKYASIQGRAQEFVYRVITSQADSRTRATYLNSVEDIDKIVKSYNSIESKISLLQPQTVTGYHARIAKKLVTDFEGVVHVNTAESIMKPHPGMVRASNRYGVGGPNGQPTMSYGFGKTPEEALQAARTEYNSYVFKRTETVESVQPFHSDKVLVLDNENLSKLGIKKNDIIQERTKDPNAYLQTNIISDNIKYNSNIDYIAAPSSPGKDDFSINLHKVRK